MGPTCFSEPDSFTHQTTACLKLRVLVITAIFHFPNVCKYYLSSFNVASKNLSTESLSKLYNRLVQLPPDYQGAADSDVIVRPIWRGWARQGPAFPNKGTYAVEKARLVGKGLRLGLLFHHFGCYTDLEVATVQGCISAAKSRHKCSQ